MEAEHEESLQYLSSIFVSEQQISKQKLEWVLMECNWDREKAYEVLVKDDFKKEQ